MDFHSYISDLKAKVNLVELIQTDEPLRQEGRSWRGVSNHSLQVSPANGLWREWGETKVGGDAITWMEYRHKMDFKTAVEELARRFNHPLPEWGREDAQARLAAQARYDALTVAAKWFQAKLAKSEAAVRYCKRRGWTGETVRDEGLGFWDGDRKGLVGEFKMHGIAPDAPVARAMLGIPPNMLIYPHYEWGKVVYVSGRYVGIVTEDDDAYVVWDALTDEETRFPFIDDDSRKSARAEAHRAGKRHYNPPRDLLGERRPCWNYRATIGHDQIVVVEGQADKVALAQLGQPAIALAGIALDDQITDLLARHSTVWLGLDEDSEGVEATAKLADALGPLTRVVSWPTKDPGEWLEGGADAAAATELLAAAPIWIELVAERVGALPEADQPEALDELMQLAARMEPTARAVYRRRLAKAAGISLSQFDQLVRVALEMRQTDDEGDDDEEMLCAVGGTLGGHLLEMIYIPPDDQESAHTMTLDGGEAKFAIRYPEGEIKVEPHFIWEGRRFRPISANTPVIREQAVRFAPYVGDALSAPDLIERIQALIHKYVDIDEFYENLAAYYVLFTWVYDVFDTLPYLRIKGDTGTGKSRFQQVVGSLCFRPMLMNAGASISSLFRTMHQFRGTLVLDEADFQASDEASAIAKLLNIGYQRRQGYIYRSGDRNSNFETEMFMVFGPKVIGTRKNYDDKAIESRCLTREMVGPTTRSDIPKNLPDDFWELEVPAMQALLLRFRLDVWSPDLNRRDVVEDDSIEPRLQQVITPLLKMVDDDDLVAALKTFIRRYNQQMIAERGMTNAAKILDALYILHHNQRDAPADELDFSLASVAELANDLMDYENERPIEKWARFAERPKFKITPKGAGNEARKSLGLHSERSGKQRRYQIIWDEVRIEALWRRYGLGDDDAREALMQNYQDIQEAIARHQNGLAPAKRTPTDEDEPPSDEDFDLF